MVEKCNEVLVKVFAKKVCYYSLESSVPGSNLNLPPR